jgi:hypothetical protein
MFNSSSDNHKPDLGSTSSLSSLQLQPSTSAPSSYNLSFSDDAGKYKYNGIRTSGDGQYVLIFDPENKRFVLHRIDSTFDMNLISAPWEKSASTLQSQYSQLESAANPRSEVPQRKPSKSSKNTVITKPEPKRRKSTQVKKKPPVRDPTPEEEEDSDDGLTVEYPDAPSSRQYKPQPNSIPRRKTIENDSEEDGDEDADAEGELEEPGNQDVDHFKLPSPANNNTGGMSDEDIELDLEAELEQALKETTEGAGEDESDESEEE